MATPEPIEGIDFSSEGIRDIKDRVTDMRDKFLAAGNWDATRLLTHTIVYLGDYALKVDAEEQELRRMSGKMKGEEKEK
jgi:hypothetical protein